MPAEPWPWPLSGPCPAEEAALVVIDLQGDFVHPEGWFASLGVDVGRLRSVLPVVARILAAARSVPGLSVVHTRQGNAPDLSDLPPVKQEQGRRTGRPIGHPGRLGRALVRGEPGWEIVSEVAPAAGELVVDKPGFSAFTGTGLDATLRERGIRCLVVTGVTANVCVLATLYAAVDLGYDCLVVADAVAAATDEHTAQVLDLVRYQSGLFGAVSHSAALIAALGALAPRPGCPPAG